MMKILTLVGVGFLLILSAEATRTPEGRIVGGDPADILKTPYIVSIAKTFDKHINHTCGGSIIADNWILTAAHCGIKTEGTVVRAGSNYSASGGITAKVLEVFNHKGFDSQTVVNDIALLKLDRPITGPNGGKIIEMIPEKQSVPAGQVVRVSGWGVTASGSSESSETLQTVEVDIVDHAKCNSQYGGGNRITQTMICAARKGKDACQMDSGGPLVVNDNELVGVVSWGVGCADENASGVYTKVSEYRDWIKNLSGV